MLSRASTRLLTAKGLSWGTERVSLLRNLLQETLPGGEFGWAGTSVKPQRGYVAVVLFISLLCTRC